jgi:uncharacterized protein YjbI with pentapeptide repeats
LTNTNLNGADLTGAKLANAKVENVSLRGTKLSENVLDGLDESQLDIGDAPKVVSFSEMDLEVRGYLESHQKWIETNGAEGKRGVMDGLDLSYHDLNGLDLSGIQMRDAKLRGAQLKACSLILADLGGTDIFDANLCDAIIIGTNLTGANLKRCDLTNAEVGEISILAKDGTKTGRSHKTSFEAANLVRANTKGCDLAACVMEKSIRDN